MGQRVIACRCEDVTLAELQAAIAAGAASAAELKHLTRAGMGVCGGRTCRPLLERLLPETGGGASAGFTQRMPVRPLTIGELAATTLAADQTTESDEREEP